MSARSTSILPAPSCQDLAVMSARSLKLSRSALLASSRPNRSGPDSIWPVKLWTSVTQSTKRVGPTTSSSLKSSKCTWKKQSAKSRPTPSESVRETPTLPTYNRPYHTGRETTQRESEQKMDLRERELSLNPNLFMNPLQFTSSLLANSLTKIILPPPRHLFMNVCGCVMMTLGSYKQLPDTYKLTHHTM